ncbi:MAG: beta-ketoacyl-[acyl-carrier-protein] synthase family protein [Thermoguttaceae bacterium]|jgi:3-oxoacyl-[acyl-carrier-protein] synthase II|nr:beta-ketoacyl-[acyl-carrier-protein] synthase family protein [Thermoguttaceae bacterium]MDI9444147.1 beta-ketoacyl-[acyl-carrier-protein] synthase family protein [Planctomycetota bacterium]
MSRRVVITGAGCATPLGTDLAKVWRSLTEGRSGIGPISLFDAGRFPVRIAAEVKDLDQADFGSSSIDWSAHPRQTRFAATSAVQAAQAAGIAPGSVDSTRLGVYLGCGEIFWDLSEFGPLMAEALRDGRFDPARFFREALCRSEGRVQENNEPNMPSYCLAGLFDAQGPNLNCIAACASSTQAIGGAAEVIRRNEADVMFAGGAHSMVNPIAMSGLHLLSVLSTDNDRGPAAMRPFDGSRQGFVVGEGGAVVVLEELEHARSRGAEILGELTGFASSHDAYRVTDTHPDGRGYVHCVRQALQQARLNLTDIDYINAHGTSTVLNDRIETLALKRAFGREAYLIPVSSTKSMMGHATTACGAIEMIVALMAVRTGVVPPTINYETFDPDCDLDYVPNTAREIQCRHVLSNSLGFGGQNATIVVSRFDEASPSRGTAGTPGRRTAA